MTEIMQSIHHNWCELIISGKKTIEVRKTRPKCDTPFKVDIYCTQDFKNSNYLIQRADSGKYMAGSQNDYCEECGQAIDWSEEK